MQHQPAKIAAMEGIWETERGAPLLLFALKMRETEFALVTKAHTRRNGTSYVSPFPPVSKAEAQSLLAILEKYIVVAHQLTGVPYP